MEQMMTPETVNSEAYKLFLAELHQDLRNLQTDVKLMGARVSGTEITLRLENTMQKIRERSERVQETAIIDDIGGVIDG